MKANDTTADAPYSGSHSDRQPVPPGADDAPAHVQDSVKAVAQLHDEHRARATRLQRVVNAVTAGAGRPTFLATLVLLVLVWIGTNLELRALGRHALDAPPFVWLQGTLTLLSLMLTAMVLITQRHEDDLAARRDRLTLELALLSEAKTAKIIALIEELRRDMPSITDRTDHEAAAMAQPMDPLGLGLDDGGAH